MDTGGSGPLTWRCHKTRINKLDFGPDIMFGVNCNCPNEPDRVKARPTQRSYQTAMKNCYSGCFLLRCFSRSRICGCIAPWWLSL